MKGKNKGKKFIFSGAFVVCMAFAILFTVFGTKASGETTGVVYEPCTKENTVPTKGGFLFGGWYQAGNDEEPVTNPEQGKTYYAKFVPENVLGIKAQVSNTILADSTEKTAAIRFVTTIDSVQYRKIGFLIQKGTGEVKEANVTNTVYESLYQVTDQDGTLGNTPEEVSPAIFDAASKYFKTYTIRKVPDSAYNTDITVTPYWITLDGTKVMGTKSIKTVNLGRSWVYMDAAYGYFPVSDGNYEVLPEDVTYLGSETAPIIDYDNGGQKFATNVNTAYNSGKPGGQIQLLDAKASHTGEGENATWTGGTAFTYGLGVHPCNGREGYTDIDLTGLQVDTFYSAVGITNIKTMYNVQFCVYGKVNENDEWKMLMGYTTVEKGTSGEIRLDISGYSYLRLAVKQVEKYQNLGSAWANACVYQAEKEEYGTYNHPFTSLADALNGIRRENGGKVTVKGNSMITIPGSFNWTKHTVAAKDQEKACNIMITGETASAGIDFSAVKELHVRDNVTFDGMTLKFYGKSLEDYGEVYANGNQFTINTGVTSDNKFTTIFGGSKNADVTGDTNVELYSGRYKAVFGGGYTGGVDGSTHVTVENVNIYTPQGEYDSKKTEKNRVVGGSYNGGTITGDTHVTVGNNFNATANLNDKGTVSHSELSAIFGGSYGIKKADEAAPAKGIVKGSTYITLQDNAKTNYIYGGGDQYSSVEGTCNVTMSENSSAMSIWGGAYRGENKDTSIIMNGGRVEQIFGGNQNGMTGNTYIEIGKGAVITRRVYGGCYNSYDKSTGNWAATMHYVNGYTTVAVKDSEALQFVGDLLGLEDNGFCAGSRCNANSEQEVGVFIFTDNIYGDVSNKIGYKGLLQSETNAVAYNYLIDATTGGTVKAGGKLLQIVPTSASAKGTVAFKDDENVQVYFNAECSWPMVNVGATTQKNVKVDFAAAAMADTSAFEASIEEAYYAQLEDAADAANLKTNGIVTVLKDTVDISRTLVAEQGADFTVRSDTAATITAPGDTETVCTLGDAKLILDGIVIERTASNEKALVSVRNQSTVTMKGETSRIDGKKDSFTGRGVEVQGTFKLEDGTIIGHKATGGTGLVTVDNVGTRNSQHLTDGSGVYVVNGGSFEMNGGYMEENDTKVDVSGSAVSVNGTGATFTLRGGEIRNNAASYGAVMVRSGKFDMSGGYIKENTARNSGGGVVVSLGTFTMSGGEISGNTAQGNSTSSYGGGGIYISNGGSVILAENSTGTIKDNNVPSKSGGGISVNHANATLSIKGGTIEKNSAANGGGMAILNCKTAEMTGGDILGNTATNSHGGGVYITQGTFTMDAGSINQNTAKSNGGAVCVNGSNATFTMNGGDMKNNFGVNGGGISIRVCKSATMSSGTIEGNRTYAEDASNTAGFGGGIYLYQGVTFTMKGGNILSNVSRNGGGIYFEPRTNDTSTPLAATMNFTDGTISGNTATNGNGIRCGNGTEARRGTIILWGGKQPADIKDGITNMTIQLESGSMPES